MKRNVPLLLLASLLLVACGNREGYHNSNRTLQKTPAPVTKEAQAPMLDEEEVLSIWQKFKSLL